jgi:hypothetical protein
LLGLVACGSSFSRASVSYQISTGSCHDTDDVLKENPSCAEIISSRSSSVRQTERNTVLFTKVLGSQNALEYAVRRATEDSVIAKERLDG